MTRTAPRIAHRLAIAAALLAGGCVRLGYGHRMVDGPIDKAALESLRPGTDDLGTCLHRLGAPHFVWEYRGDGMALGWVWSDSSDWDFDASYAIIDRVPGVSFGLDWDDFDFPGTVLWFDGDLKLIEWKLGSMRDLTTELRRRSSPVDDG